MFRAELLKLSTTMAAKVAAGVGLIGLVLTQITLVTVLPALASGAIGPGREALGPDLPAFDISTRAGQFDAISPLGAASGGGSIGIAVLAVLVLGVLAGTTDYRFGGIVPTVLAEPRRGRILLAKTAALAVVSVVVGLAYAVVSLVTLLVSLPIAGAALELGVPELVGVLGAGTAVVVLLTLLGLAVGVLARSQLVGVIVMIGILVLELMLQGLVQLVTGTLPLWAQLLPLTLGQQAVSPASGLIAPPLALLALAAIVAAALAVAALALRRRDV